MEVRAFIATEFDNKIKKRIGFLQEYLKQADADVKWVKTDIIHFTMKFLGDHLDLKEVPAVQDVMQEAVSEYGPIDLSIKHLNAFPSLKKPRVIVVSLHDESGALKEIHRKMDIGLNELGFPKENRSFKPHLTVGRIKSQKNLDELMKLVEEKKHQEFGMQTIDTFTLFMSQLRKQGPEYSPLGEVYLV